MSLQNDVLAFQFISRSWQGEPLHFSPLHPLSLRYFLHSIFAILTMPKFANNDIRNKNHMTEEVPRTRCTSSDRDMIIKKAKHAGLTPSAYVRQACIHSRIVVNENKADAALIKQLMAIGNNLNQLTKIAHVRALRSGEQVRLDAVLTSLQKILDSLL